MLNFQPIAMDAH